MIESIINEVAINMDESVDINKLKNVLYIVLNKYDITQKEGIICRDNEWEYSLKTFLFRKHVEGKTEGTIQNYKFQLSRALSYINKPINLITSEDLFKYLSYCKEIRGVSNRYLDNIRRVFSSFFGWQQKKGYITTNPADGLDNIKCETKIRKPFTDEELEKLKISCDNLRDLALVEFLYSTGVRVSECASLKISNIDFREREVIVYGKGNKERIVYLSSTAIMYLKKYLDSREDNNEELFVSNRKPHKKMSKDGIEKALRELGKKCDVANVYPHKYRRTLATNLLRKGMPIEEVKELLGHSKIDTTLIYASVNKKNVKFDFEKHMGL